MVNFDMKRGAYEGRGEIACFDHYLGPGETQVFHSLQDRGCPLSRTCLDCPMVVCIHDTPAGGKHEYGYAGAVRKTWPAGDHPERYDRFFPRKEPV